MSQLIDSRRKFLLHLAAGVGAGSAAALVPATPSAAQPSDLETKAARISAQPPPGWLNIIDFGAVYDPAIKGYAGTDSTPAFQRAIDEGQRTGRPVYIPAGSYRLGRLKKHNGIYLRPDHATFSIFGDGPETSLLCIDEDVERKHSHSDLFRSNRPTKKSRKIESHVVIRDLGFRSLWSQHPGYQGINVLMLSDFTSVRIENVSATDLRGKFSRSVRYHGFQQYNSRPIGTVKPRHGQVGQSI